MAGGVAVRRATGEPGPGVGDCIMVGWAEGGVVAARDLGGGSRGARWSREGGWHQEGTQGVGVEGGGGSSRELTEDGSWKGSCIRKGRRGWKQNWVAEVKGGVRMMGRGGWGKVGRWSYLGRCWRSGAERGGRQQGRA